VEQMIAGYEGKGKGKGKRRRGNYCRLDEM
jgi:hypothetical protein